MSDVLIEKKDESRKRMKQNSAKRTHKTRLGEEFNKKLKIDHTCLCICTNQNQS